MGSSFDLAYIRSQVPITRSRAYLFSGALAPAALPVLAAWNSWSTAWQEDPNSVYTAEALIGSSASLRASFARLIGGDPAGVAITDNTSRAANIAIRALAGRRGNNVVVDSGTYPSSLYPWYARGEYEVRLVETDGIADAAGAMAARVNDGTVAICVSHVAPLTGRRHDLAALAALAHRHDAALVVDAAQSTGVVPIDVRREGVDILVTTAMKWLMGPPGVGFLYLATNVLDKVPVLDVGYLGLEGRRAEWPRDRMPTVSADARRYELGLPNLPGVLAAKAGIDLLMEVGIIKVAEHVNKLTTRCLEGLAEQSADIVTPLDPNQRAGVIAVSHPRAERIFECCRDARVDIGVAGNLRVDPHVFNNEDDIDRFLDSFEQFNR